MTLIRASMATAIPDRSKVLNGLETLVIGAAGGLLFLWAGLPGGLISGAMCAVGIAALAGRPPELRVIAQHRRKMIESRPDLNAHTAALRLVLSSEAE